MADFFYPFFNFYNLSAADLTNADLREGKLAWQRRGEGFTILKHDRGEDSLDQLWRMRASSAAIASGGSAALSEMTKLGPPLTVP